MDAFYQPDPDVFSSVLLAERLVFGFLFAAHGTQTLFGWFRGAGGAELATYIVDKGKQLVVMVR